MSTRRDKERTYAQRLLRILNERPDDRAMRIDRDVLEGILMDFSLALQLERGRRIQLEEAGLTPRPAREALALARTKEKTEATTAE